MSRLAEVLGVPEGVEFKFEGSERLLKIENGKRMVKGNDCGKEYWFGGVSEAVLTKMINNPEKIHIVKPKIELTEEQKTAVKGLFVMGWKWIARDKDEELFVYESKPELVKKMTGLTARTLVQKLLNIIVFSIL